ncbi:MAG: hypothetical protein KAQ65_03785 [Candidatus Thorarchaeota archaeon]|nr:hypothetical protein [Candidatus Thorarchaeota archaeon]MCK5237909.1 hypothetical protein [Candidatus Thorarchaeota archaeon]
MDRKQRAGIYTIVGIVLFLASMLFILPIPEFYLLALILMFIGIVLIGVGGAMLKGFDKALYHPEEECYYCGGKGKKDGPDGEVICSRCGGTGKTPPDAI